MSATDRIPAELRDRIVRADKALNTVILTKGLDYPTYCRRVAAARRELAGAFRAAYEHIAASQVVFSLAVLNAYHNLEGRADEDEREARDVERRQAAAGGRT
jgi:hypothetical protein